MDLGGQAMGYSSLHIELVQGATWTVISDHFLCRWIHEWRDDFLNQNKWTGLGDMESLFTLNRKLSIRFPNQAKVSF